MKIPRETETTAPESTQRRVPTAEFLPRCVLPTVLFIASIAFLATAVLGSRSHIPQPSRGGTSVPPRLFLNGEVARVAATGKKVVVQSAQWDKGCHCYIYTVKPL